MSILKQLGFGLSADERRARENDKYKVAIAKVKAEIKELYKKNINANSPQMNDLEQLAAIAAGDATAADIDRDRKAMVKEATKYLEKKQQPFEAEWTEARKILSELKHLAISDNDKTALEQIRVRLEEGDLTKRAKQGRYDAALSLLRQIRSELDTRLSGISAVQKKYIKERDKVQAALKQLLVIGFESNSAEYRDLDGKLTAAANEATAENWQDALAQLKGWTGVMNRNDVKQARTQTEQKLAQGTFKPSAAFIEANQQQPPKSDEDLWAEAVLDLCNVKPRLDKGDFHDQDIKIQIQPSEYMKYKRLQEKIAATGLEENERPTIDLTVKGKNAPVASFGIIGGTGPLSDAEMLEKTMEGLHHAHFDDDDVYIRLMSAPPPRPVDGGMKSKKGARYLQRMLKFSGEPHSKMALASNTAHANLGSARLGRTIGGGGRKQAAGAGETHQVKDLSASVVASVTSDERLAGRTPKPLILGTKVAYDQNLYGKKFDETGVGAGNVDPKDSIQLQEWIDEAKRGHADANLATQLQDFIKGELVKNPDATHIVLGCTELPLALGGKAQIQNFEDAVNQERANQAPPLPSVYFVDTEDIFAQEYTAMVQENKAESPAAPVRNDEDERDEAMQLDDKTRRAAIEDKAELIELIVENLQDAAPPQDEEEQEEDEQDEAALINTDYQEVAQELFTNITDNEPDLAGIAERSGIPQPLLRVARDAAFDAWWIEVEED